MTRAPDHRGIADVLERVADLLEIQDANSFRVRAHRNAAHLLRTREEPVARRRGRPIRARRAQADRAASSDPRPGRR
jgi:DNA polymerase/3'-5' exonuclease PolX